MRTNEIGSNLIFALLFLCVSLKSHLSFGDDSIAANQALSGDQTLISKGGNFELGFFAPGKSSSKFYIGIWYKKISPQTVVWVANREYPVKDNRTSTLRIQDGNLVLLDESQKLVWSTNVTSASSSPVMAVLKDDGNLVLNSTSIPSIWESFDNPTDTWLPGGKLAYNKVTNKLQTLTSWKNSEDPATGNFSLELDPKAAQYVIKWNRSQQYWISGSWNGQTKLFSLVPETTVNRIYNYSYVDNANESYITYSLYNPSIISRFVMDVSGKIMQLFIFDISGNTQQWNLFWAQPRQQCEVYAFCGEFGVCNENSSPFCSCLDGFEHKSDEDWNLNDFSGGCERKIGLQCENNGSAKGERDKFRVYPNLKLPENAVSMTVGSAAECESSCLSNCSCGAYAYDSSGCSILKEKLLNLQQLSADDNSGRTIYIRLSASDFSSGKNSSGAVIVPDSEGKHSIGVIIGTTVAAVVLLTASISCFFYRRRILAKGTGKESVSGNLPFSYDDERDVDNLVDEDNKIVDLAYFTLESILEATENFADANKLGQGGFGPVYKGMFPGGQEIAVKRLLSKSGQGMNEFRNEVVLIAKLQHRNLVRLLGYCIKGSERLLLYEYMPNKSLDNFIFDQGRCILLDWNMRFDIILGITRGLLYLHQDSRLRIIHRDLKTSNILLDEDMNPKISDFGLARMFADQETEANTMRVVGTYGYMSPEYAQAGFYSVKSDVFSFGVIILEIISGKRNTGFHYSEEALSLLGYAWRLWEEKNAIKIMDNRIPELSDGNDREVVIKYINIGLLCVQEDPSDRPNMSNVLHMLGSEATSLPSPKKPGFVSGKYTSRSNMFSSSSPQKLEAHSLNKMTISLLDGR